MNAQLADRGVPANDSFIHAARRAQLVRCAIEVIDELGVERASVVKIAQRAGVSRGVVTYHFRDLDDLHRSVVAEVYRLGGERLRQPVAEAATPRDALRLFVSGSLDFYTEFPQHIGALTEIFTALRRTAGRSRGESPQHASELDDVARLLREGQRQGQFRDFDADVMAATVRAVLDTGRASLARGAQLEPLRAELVASVEALTRKENDK